MKILEIIPNLFAGGAERFTVDLCNELVKIPDNEVFLCTLLRDDINSWGFYKSQLDSKVKYVNISCVRKLKDKIVTLYRLYRLIKKVEPDVIHAHLGAISYLYPLVFCFKRICFVHTIHNDVTAEKKSKVEKTIRFLLYKKWIKPVTISPSCYTSFKKCYGYNTSYMINNGVIPKSLSVNFSTVKKEVENYKRNAETKVFVNIARLQPQKNHQLLIDTFNKLIDENYNILLLVIGDYNAYIEYAQPIMNSANKKNIFFLGKKENVFDYLSIANAFCLSSNYEGLPMTLIESMAVGCYALCTDVGGVKDVVVNDKLGLLAKSVSLADYYAIIKEFLLSKKTYDKNYIKNYFQENFSMSICARNYMTLFKQMSDDNISK